jgi:hypothetical protein
MIAGEYSCRLGEQRSSATMHFALIQCTETFPLLPGSFLFSRNEATNITADATASSQYTST